MAFNPLAYKKQVMLVSSLGDDIVKDHYRGKIAEMLDDTGITKVESTTNSFEFKAPPFRWVWNGFHIFNAVSGAKIHFTKPERVLYISYTFRFHELFLICLALSLSTVPAVLTSNYKWMSIILAGIWVIFYLTGVSVVFYRFRKWVNSTLDKFEYEMAEEAGDLPFHEMAETLEN